MNDKTGKVLLVEKESIEAAYIRSLLVRNGWQVEVAKSLQAATEKIGECQFLAILLNLNLVGKQNVSFAEELVEKESQCEMDIPVIGLSDYSYKLDIGQFEPLKIKTYLAKPIYQQQLLKALESV